MINENGSFNWYAPYIGVVSRRLDPQVLKRSLTLGWCEARALVLQSPQLDPEKRECSSHVHCTTRQEEQPKPCAQMEGHHNVLGRPPCA